MASKFSVASGHAMLFVLLFLPAHSIVNLVRRDTTEVEQHTHATQAKGLNVPLTVQSHGQVAVPISIPEPHQKQHHPENVFEESMGVLRTFAMAVTLTISMVLFLYWRKGPVVVFRVILYLLALASIKGAVKVVQDKGSFKFPLFLTGCHFISCLLIAFAILIHGSIVSGEKMAVPSLQGFGTRFGPIAVACAGSVAMGNMALVHSTSAFVEILGASAPIVTVLMTLFMKQPFNLKLLGPCFLVFGGCALTAHGEASFSMIGLLLAAGSNIPRAIKSVLQQLLLQSDPDAVTYSPMEVLAWTSVPSSVIMFSWSFFQEGTTPYHQLYQQGFFSFLTGALLISCANACFLNTAILFVIKDLGAVGTQLVAQLKSVLVVLGGMCFLHEQVSRLEFVGFALVMVGVFLYNDIDSRLKTQSKADLAVLEEKAALVASIKKNISAHCEKVKNVK